MDCKDVEAFVNQSGGYVVLGAQGVGTGDVHIGPTGSQNLAQMRGLGLQMHAEGYFKALEGQCPTEILLNSVQKGHVGAYPAELEFSAFPKVYVSDVAHKCLRHPRLDRGSHLECKVTK